MSVSYQPLDADIIIIGAGVSGLTAAYHLLTKFFSNFSPDRIGGRTFSTSLSTQNGNSCVFDLGGQWISSQQDLLLNFLDQLDIKIEKCQQNGKIIIDYNRKLYKKHKNSAMNIGNLIDNLQLAAFITKIENLCNGPLLDEDLESKNLEQFIDENVSTKTTRNLIKSMIFNYFGIEVCNLTVGFYVFFCTSTHGIVNQLLSTSNGLNEFWIKNGAQEICNKISTLLESNFGLLTNSEVTSIQKDRFHFKIISKSGNYYSTNVIMAIPPSSVLKIKFVPSLSDSKRRILSKELKGEFIKFVVTYPTAFWKKKGLSGDVFVVNGYSLDRPLVRCFDITTEAQAALTGYTLKNANKTNKQFTILKQLSQYFGNEALTPLDFIAEEGCLIENCPTYDDLLELRKSDGKLFWAGAEFSLQWYGTIAGAVFAANRVVREALYDLRPSSLSLSDMTYFTLTIEQIKPACRTYSSIYQKAISPYYYIAGILILLILWRMKRIGILGYIYTHLKNVI